LENLRVVLFGHCILSLSSRRVARRVPRSSRGIPHPSRARVHDPAHLPRERVRLRVRGRLGVHPDDVLRAAADAVRARGLVDRFSVSLNGIAVSYRSI
jgi:hypothetical protein